MLDVLIAGAGPAGSIAALVLARAGARVLVLDRESFPRDKLCGDTLNPGAIAALESLQLTGGPLATARPLAGMIVSGPGRAIRAEYGGGVVGRAVTRRDLDAWLLDAAVNAGAKFEEGWVVRGPLLDDDRGGWTAVRGLRLTRKGADREMRLPACLTIAADGRRSAATRGLGLLRPPPAPRRWAFGTYAHGVGGTSDVGEMHVRRGFYLGIAPLGGDRCNVCVVTGPRPDGKAPLDVVRRAIARDAELAARFANAQFESSVRVLGPLAVEASAAGVTGLFLAGDAAGFVDPMTGDGLRLAIAGGRLAALECLATLEDGDFAGAPTRLASARQRILGPKLRFNRALRALVGSPAAIRLASLGAAVMPSMIRRAVRYAGDADLQAAGGAAL